MQGIFFLDMLRHMVYDISKIYGVWEVIKLFNNLYREMASKDRMTQKQLAIILGISAKAMSNKFCGKTQFNLKEMQQIKSVFDGKPLEYLFQTDQPQRTA